MFNLRHTMAAMLIAGFSTAHAGTPAASSTPAPDKSGYTLFHPVPDDQLRDFDTDRPDKTNSAITVDAGRFQLEMDLLNYTRDGHGANRSETWLWANTNLRMGLCNNADLQLMVPFGERADGHTGTGDMAVAVKANLWGNDGGDSAAGIEAVLSLPTGSHGLSADTVQATLLAIYQTSFGDFDAAVNTGVNIAASDGGGHHAEIVNSLSVGHSLFGPVSAYVEFYSQVPTTNSSDWVGTVDTGLLWLVSKNFQIDAGINVGVTHAADDLQTFVGFSWRM